MPTERLKVVLEMVTGQYKREAREAAGSTRQVASSAESAGTAASGMGTKIKGTVGGLAAVAGGALAVKEGLSATVGAYASFDDKMTKSLAIMGDVSDTMRGDMSDAAREVAKTTTFSADQAAESYFFLASAGMDATQSIEAMPAVAKFAQAGMFDMALATDLATDAQSALGLASDDSAQNLENLTRVTDVFVRANTLANTSVEQVAQAMTNKAGAALRAVGKDIEEGTAVLAAFADQGTKGAEAGTQLSIVMRDLQTRAIENKEAFADAGIAVFDESGEMRNMADIIGEIETRLAGMSDAQIKAELSTLGFTDKSIAALTTLLGTSDAIREYEEELRNAAGTTEEIADKQLESVSAQWEIFKSTVGDTALEIGENLIPVFEEAIPLLQAMAENSGDIDFSWLADVPRGAGAAGDLLGTTAKTAGNLGKAFVGLSDILSGDVVGGWKTFTGAVEEGGAAIDNLVDNTQIRRLEQGLVEALRRGEEPVQVLANQLVGLDRAGELTIDTISRFGRVAGVTDEQLLGLLRQMRNRQSEWGATEQGARGVAGAMTELGNSSGSSAGEVDVLEEKMNAADVAMLNMSNRGAAALVSAMDEVPNAISATAGPIGGLIGDLLTAQAESENLFGVLRSAADPVFGAVNAWFGLVEAYERTQEEGAGVREDFDLLKAEVDMSVALQQLGDDYDSAMQALSLATGKPIAELEAMFEMIEGFDGETFTATFETQFRSTGTPPPQTRGNPNTGIVANFHGGSFDRHEMFRAGEQNMPEMMIIPGDAGRVFSHADTRSLIHAVEMASVGPGPGGGDQVSITIPSTGDPSLDMRNAGTLAGLVRRSETRR